MNEIITFFIVIISVLVGYFIGSKNNPISKENVDKLRNTIIKTFEKRDLGAVPRPTAHEIEKFENPVLKAEEEEMSKTFSKIIK